MNDQLFGKEMFIQFTVRVFRECLSICVCVCVCVSASLPFVFWGWNVGFDCISS